MDVLLPPLGWRHVGDQSPFVRQCRQQLYATAVFEVTALTTSQYHIYLQDA
jgi:hypothetical protein